MTSRRYYQEPWKILDDGSIGFFWRCWGSGTPSLDEAGRERGYLRRTGRMVTVETLTEGLTDAEIVTHRPPHPEVVAAMLSSGSGLLHHIVQSGASVRIGRTAASSSTVHGQTYIGDLELDELRSTLPLALYAHFPQVSPWMGDTALSEDYEAPEGGGFAVLLRLSHHDETLVSLPDGRRLSLRPDWHSTGPGEHRTILARLNVGCRSATPRPVADLLRPLLAVQDLLSLVHGEPIVASSGAAWMDYPDNDAPRSGGWLWSAPLMERHDSFEDSEHPPYPLLRLSGLGGVEGVARWVELAERHPRATSPVVRTFREGPLSASVALMEIAAGIEYWVKANRPAPWTDGRFTEALSRSVGESFDRWVGGADRWGRAFWLAYTSLKHEPSFERPPVVLRDLAESGRWLLAAGLLNHVSNSSTPAEQLFGDGGFLTQLGREVRDAVSYDSR